MDEYARGDVIVAYSGGVDSALLLKIACEAAKRTGTTVTAVTIKTKLHPSGEADEAARTAADMGAEHEIIEVDELEEAGIENNPKDRCYLCKKYMFSKVKALARQRRISTIIEGTNADDLKVYRPGIQAIRELEIKSPLADANLTKAEVRALAKEYGLSAAGKPSTPCLATRFPYDTKISYDEMRRVEKIEEEIRRMGFYNVRARVHGELVRIEVDKEKIPALIERRDVIIPLVKSLGYKFVTIDIEGFRSGSFDT